MTSGTRHSPDFIGPVPYGCVVVHGQLYPEVSVDCTRYEADWLKLTVLEARLIEQGLQALTDRGDGIAWALMTKLRAIHDELVDEGSYDFWEQQPCGAGFKEQRDDINQ